MFEFELLVYLLIFIIGIVLGSVANAIIYRLPNNIAWSRGKSMCPNCKHGLNCRDLVPVVSYLVLRGRCRYCNIPIGVRYLLVELIMGVGFLLIFSSQFPIFNQLSVISFLVLAAIFWVSMVIAVMDWETKLVSEAMVIVWGGLGVIYNLQFLIFNNFSITQFAPNFLGVLVGVVVIGGVWAVTRGKAMGFGDVEMAVALGIWLGWPKTGVALWVAFVVGGLYGVYMLSRQRLGLKSEIAFGTFLVMGAWVAFVFGDEVLSLVLWPW